MKKIFLQLVFIFLFSNSFFAQDVPEVQRPLLTKISATWCPPCGGWGWTMMENMVMDNEEKATLIVAHHDGQLVTASGDAFSSNFNSPYQPFFYMYNGDVGVTSSNATTKRTEIKDMVDVEAAKSPVVNAGMILTLDGTELQIETKTKFFQSTSGEYYLGIYAVENEVVNFQQGQGSNAIHEKVLRGKLNAEIFGELITSGDIDASSEFDKSFSATLSADWNTDHLEIVTVVWKKEGDTFVAINTNLSTTFEPPVANVNILLENASMEILPNVISSQATVNIDLEEELQNATIELFDLDGKKVTDIFQGKLPNGNSQFTIERNSVVTQGMYFIVLKSEGKVITKRIVFN